MCLVAFVCAGCAALKRRVSLFWHFCENCIPTQRSGTCTHSTSPRRQFMTDFVWNVYGTNSPMCVFASVLHDTSISFTPQSLIWCVYACCACECEYAINISQVNLSSSCGVCVWFTSHITRLMVSECANASGDELPFVYALQRCARLRMSARVLTIMVMSYLTKFPTAKTDTTSKVDECA